MELNDLLDRLGIDGPAFRDRVREDLAGRFGAEDYSIAALPGGASVRGYARLGLKGSGVPPSLVLMILSDPDPAKGVEEVIAGGAITELPFINVYRHLDQAGVPMPRVLHYNEDAGLLYMEDCGSVHLRDKVEDAESDIKRFWFERAIDELVKIQLDATRLPADDFLGFMVRFDRELLLWELNHFLEYAVDARFPGAVSGDDRRAFAAHFERIADELLEGNYALCHRDYHMDNIMIDGGAVKVIDFQDALMGPLAYDLACLLFDRDTSDVLGGELIAGLADYYADAFEARSAAPLARADFRRCFELCVIHRLLKVVGRFHFIDQVKKRPEYLEFNQYMLPALAEYLGRGPERQDLLGLVGRYLPEIREYMD